MSEVQYKNDCPACRGEDHVHNHPAFENDHQKLKVERLAERLFVEHYVRYCDYASTGDVNSNHFRATIELLKQARDRAYQVAAIFYEEHK